MSSNDRSLKVLSRTEDAVSVRVADGNSSSDYLVERVRSDFGVGFKITRTAGRASKNSSGVYHVNLEPGEMATCSCPGGIYRGRCKHAAMCRMLHNRGMI